MVDGNIRRCYRSFEDLKGKFVSDQNDKEHSNSLQWEFCEGFAWLFSSFFTVGGVSIAELLQRHGRDRRIETKKNPVNCFWSQLTNACQPKDPTR